MRKIPVSVNTVHRKEVGNKGRNLMLLWEIVIHKVNSDFNKRISSVI